jgi:S-adenosylmethionine synthetase
LAVERDCDEGSHVDLHFTSSGYVHPDALEFEVVERKGVGHPDSLADGLAEAVSAAYSRFTLQHTGYVLHHNVDKLSILGGESQVRFGSGRLAKPIRVVLNGRFSDRIGDMPIPVLQLASVAIRSYLGCVLPLLDVDRDIVILDQTSLAASPGKGPSFFRPASECDLPELLDLKSNDSVVCVGYFPLSNVEQAVLALERFLNSGEFKRDKPVFGSDIKILATRLGNSVELTACVPLVARYVPEPRVYAREKEYLLNLILARLDEYLSGYEVAVSLNTKDDLEASLLYLTAIGSSIESGDEGQVGRGNRVGGLIPVMRSASVEAACGKNPVYHTGKVYGVLAHKLARRLFAEIGAGNQVCMVTQNGRSLEDPQFVVVQSAPMDRKQQSTAAGVVLEELANLRSLSESILSGQFDLF